VLYLCQARAEELEKLVVELRAEIERMQNARVASVSRDIQSIASLSTCNNCRRWAEHCEHMKKSLLDQAKLQEQLNLQNTAIEQYKQQILALRKANLQYEAQVTAKLNALKQESDGLEAEIGLGTGRGTVGSGAGKGITSSRRW